MLTYEEFKDVVTGCLPKYLPVEYQDVTVEEKVAHKTNQALDVLAFHKEGQGAAPMLYVLDLYERYKNGEHMEDILNTSAGVIAENIGCQMGQAMEVIKDAESIKSHLVFQVINTEMNQALLTEAPHRDLLDLSVVYRVLAGDGVSMVVTSGLAGQMGITEEELYAAALENTEKLLPPVCLPLNELLQNLFGPAVNLDEAIPSDVPAVYVMGNKENYLGAAALLYKGRLQALADQLGSDLYILPSSIHEILAITAEGNNREALDAIVQEVNQTEAAQEEFLADHIYFYDRTLQELQMVSE